MKKNVRRARYIALRRPELDARHVAKLAGVPYKLAKQIIAEVRRP